MKLRTIHSLIAKLLLAVAAAAGTLTCQGPAFVPNCGQLVSFEANRVDRLNEQWPQSRLGQMLADPDIAPAARACLEQFQQLLTRRKAVHDAVYSADLEMEPYELAQLLRDEEREILRILEHPITELQSASWSFAVASQSDGQANISREMPLVTVQCQPRYQGKWAQDFEREADRLKRSGYFSEVPNIKIDGMPVRLFRSTKHAQDSYRSEMFDRWQLALPGSFSYGRRSPTIFGAIGQRTASESAGLRFRMDFSAFNDMWKVMGRQVPRDYLALGFGECEWLDWTAQFVDGLILDEAAIKIPGQLIGLTKILLGGTATPPSQALPKGGLLQLRGNIDLATLLTSPDLTEMSLPPDLVQLATKAFDGGYAAACCAPAPGGVIPRIFVSLGIADAEAAQQLLQLAIANMMPGNPDELGKMLRKVTYDGVECTTVRIPDLPNGVQPAWCIHNGALHVAESARSLRSLLKAQKSGDVAMKVEDAPLPAGNGDVLPNFEVSFDEVKTYECFYKLWLPLYELSVRPSEAARRALTRADLPEPDLFAEYCGQTRGLMRKDGDTYRIQILGALGGPEMAAALMTWGPMISSEARDYTTDRLAKGLAAKQVAAAWTALEAFQKREQRWPKDLAELFAAEKLAADALLLPADTFAEELTLADGSKTRSSFRYFGEPIEIFGRNVENKILLVEIQPSTFSRLVLDVTGATPQIWGRDSTMPIDEVGH
ncbi:MAG: hypothetical protein AB8H80_20175 [Planctomycetota bacterium]